MRNRVILAALGFIAVGFFAIVSLNYASIVRVYKAITLFDEAVIVNNFSSMESLFETVEIAKPASSHTFERATQDLPKTYNYKGNLIEVTHIQSGANTCGNRRIAFRCFVVY